ncbi:MAG: hypothetical protein DU489_03220 [Nitrosomonas sp.]|uniref:helix-turn-helix transcriptional regulator n=1 Tax=Nitrosomonas sp. TaxID=42353 RepID=UPI0032ECDADE
MKMKNYIEQGEIKAGAQKELANMLGVSASYIRMVKAGQKGLSIDLCIVLADYIEADRLEVIAASNLITEKDEKKRKILESCFQKVASVTAAAVISSILTLTPQQTVKAENLNSQFTKIQILAIE